MSSDEKAAARDDRREEARAELKARATDLLSAPGALLVLDSLGLGAVLEDVVSLRVRDLALLVNRLENAMEANRQELAVEVFFDESDARRHPGLDGVPKELEDEEALVQALQASMSAPSEAPEWFWQLALAVNAAFKGLLGAQGQSGHICARAEPVEVALSVDAGWEAVMAEVVEACRGRLQGGDVVVIADKVVAAALYRIGPRDILMNPDPKTVDPEDLERLSQEWTQRLGMKVSPLHLLLADEYTGGTATLGADDHNGRAAELAARLHALGLSVDVIISDTDTGLDTRRPLIGTVTIAATPLGATSGVNLYEAMRCAVAAEFVRGHGRGIPVVICVPAERRRQRSQIGQARQYPGVLDVRREDRIAHA